MTRVDGHDLGRSLSTYPANGGRPQAGSASIAEEADQPVEFTLERSLELPQDGQSGLVHGSHLIERGLLVQDDHITVWPTVEQRAAEARLATALQPWRVDAHFMRCRGKSAVAGQRHEVAQVLPVEPVCAFFNEHGEIIEDRRTPRHGLKPASQGQHQEDAISLTTVTRTPRNPRASALISNAVVAAVLGIRRFVVAIRRRSDLQHLVDQPDYLLADIGLTRNDLDAALSEPFWRDPTLHLERSARSGSAAGMQVD